MAHSLHGVRERFTAAFCSTFSSQDNAVFLAYLDTCFQTQCWTDALQLMLRSTKAGHKKLADLDPKLSLVWREVRKVLRTGQQTVARGDTATTFAFLEGALTEAVRQGDWILLDEVNMAAPETLECLSCLNEPGGSVTLYEACDYRAVPRHKEFRLLACMNPAANMGKADLAPGLRNRFIELYADEMTEVQDICLLVSDYLQCLALPVKQIAGIVQFYTEAPKAAATTLVSGEGTRPTFSLRTLCRALKIASRNPCGSVHRSLLEATWRCRSRRATSSRSRCSGTWRT